MREQQVERCRERVAPVNFRRRAAFDEPREEDDLHASLFRELLEGVPQRLTVDVDGIDRGTVREFLGRGESSTRR